MAGRSVALVFLALVLLSWIGTGTRMLCHPGRCIDIDSVEYLALAQGLAEGRGFRAIHDPGAPELYRTPGYPLFLCAFQPWRSMARFRFTLLVQLFILGCSGVLLSHSLMRLGIVGLSGSLTAISLLILNPVAIVLSLQFLNESLFIFCCAMGLWALVEGVLRNHRGFACLSGLAFGAATLVRPIGLVLLFVVPASLWAVAVLPGERGHRWSLPIVNRSVILIWILAAMILPAGWGLRNGLQARYWGVSKTGISFLASAYGEDYLARGEETLCNTAYDRGDGVLATARAVCRTVVSHPRESVKTFVSSLARTALGPGEWTMRRAVLGEDGDRSTLAPRIRIVPGTNGLSFVTYSGTSSSAGPTTPGVLILLGWSLGVTLIGYVLIALGLIHPPVRGSWIFGVALAGTCALFVACAGYSAYARFRVPILPFLATSSSFGCLALNRIHQAVRHRWIPFLGTLQTARHDPAVRSLRQHRGVSP